LLEEKISVKLRSCEDLGIVSGCSQESNFDFEKEVEKETSRAITETRNALRNPSVCPPDQTSPIHNPRTSTAKTEA
jgi:hypothetical protein